MRISIATTLIILAIATWLGLRNEQRISSARKWNARLISDAAHAGIRLDPTSRVRFTKRNREHRSADIPALADGLLALFAKDQASRSQEEMEPLGDRIDSLDPAGFVELLSKLRESDPMGLKSRDESLRMAIQRFSDLFPRASLEFLAESPDFFETGNPGKKNAIHTAFSGWAAEAPYAALEWYQKNKDDSPDFSGEDVQRFLLSGIAGANPKMAFELIAGSEFGREHAADIVRWAAPENRQSALDGLREYTEELNDPNERENLMELGLKSLSIALSQQDFEISEKWLNSAKLNQPEREIIAKNLFLFQPGDTGHWIEWIADALPTGEAAPKIASLVNQWAEIDYRAVADWLNTTPEGPAKSASIRAYAETLSRYQSEAAVQWAMTLTDGPERDQTLEKIHNASPKDDPAGKAAFANDHGIK